MLYTKSIRYPITFNLTTGKTDVDSDTISINRCIGLILTTGKGELLGDPNFGCRLYEMLFDQYSDILENEIKNEIVNSIKKYEKRITVYQKDITIEHNDNTDRNSYTITISYVINSRSSRDTTSVTLFDGGESVNG